MITRALEAYAGASAREWLNDRSQTVGASEIGLCARRVFYLKNEGDVGYGAERDEGHVDRWGARVRGSTYEAHWWEPALRAAYGTRLLYAGADQRTFIDGFLSATPDGLIVDLNLADRTCLGIGDAADSVLVECKTADPRTRLDGPKSEHVYQVQVQLGLVRLHTNSQPSGGFKWSSQRL